MKKLLNILGIMVILSFAVCNTFAADNIEGTSGSDFEKVGAAGAQFLKIGAGARANGMAGTAVSNVNDLSSIYWNPAGLAQVKGIAANFSYTQWFAGFDHNFAALAIPLGDQFTIGAHLTSFSSGRIEITDLNYPEGTGTYYSVNDIDLGVSLAGYLTEQFSFGVTAKYVHNGFAALGSNGVAFDIGTMYETGIYGIKLGFAVENLGTEMKYTGQDLRTTSKLVQELNMSSNDVELLTSSYSMPLIFRAGVSSEVYNHGDNKLLCALDFNSFSDVPEQFSLGAEYTWSDLLSLRAGYRFGQDQFGFAGGAGIKYLLGNVKASLDYSISPTKDLGLVNRLSINVGF